MKKLILTTITSLAAVAAFAQGTVNFLNDSVTLTSPPDRLIRFLKANTPGNVFGTDGAAAVGTNFFVQLYFGSTTSANSSSLTAVTSAPAKLRGSTTLSPGVWGSGGFRTLDGFAFGSGDVLLQVRVWDIGAQGNADWNTSLVRGASQVFAYTLPSSSGAPGGDFIMKNFAGVAGVDVVPEPTSLALAGLGAAALLVLRRKK
jgi:hypothetical protein